MAPPISAADPTRDGQAADDYVGNTQKPRQEQVPPPTILLTAGDA